MITFLASPKPFRGVAKTIQYRAIENWLAASPNSEVILYGNSEGIEQAGADLEVRVVKDIQQAPSGIPYFGAMVAHATATARHDIHAYLNCDILLGGAFEAFSRMPARPCLMIGRRIDLAEKAFVDIRQVGWRRELLKLAEDGRAQLHAASGIDYFAFRRGTFQGMPPIIVGRAGYDNAILAHCLRRRIPIIDATEGIIALHQFHDYGHVAGGKVVVFTGHEAAGNLAHAGGRHSALLVSDASHVLRDGQVLFWPSQGDRLRRLELRLRFEWGWPRLGLGLRVVWRLLNALGRRSGRPQTIRGLVEAVQEDAVHSVEGRERASSRE